MDLMKRYVWVMRWRLFRYTSLRRVLITLARYKPGTNGRVSIMPFCREQRFQKLYMKAVTYGYVVRGEWQQNICLFLFNVDPETKSIVTPAGCAYIFQTRFSQRLGRRLGFFLGSVGGVKALIDIARNF